MMPSAKLQNVDAKQDYRYQVLLVREKKKKAEVCNFVMSPLDEYC